jgi:Putative beta barrel porin-7 (BBP7)
MGIKRTAIWLIAWSALVLMANRALAQPAHSNLNYQVPHPTYENGPAPFSDDTPGPRHGLSPFHPLGFEAPFDWFAPAETSGYGRGPRPHIGYFFSYERLFWSLSAPERAPIGSETGPFFSLFPTVGPTVDNRWIAANGGWGNRFELGYVDTDDYGWLVSVLDHVSQSSYEIDHSPGISLGDPNGILDGFVPFVITDSNPQQSVTLDVGELPFIFEEIRMNNHLQLNGVELSRFYRARRLHSGAYFELLYGARWFQINDTIVVQADGNGTGTQTVTLDPGIGFDPATFTFPLNILDGSTWSNRALNNLVGPQIGGRLFVQRGRWVTSLEARFLAAANFQNIHLKTNLGDQTLVNQSANVNITTTFQGLGVDTQRYRTTFSPLGELRVNVAWQATRNVGLKVGYTGMVVGGISRASNTIDYDSVNLIGISDGNNHQIFFVNGVNFGVEINR